ncbi:PEP-CTERM sorting domain-containing protein [Fortiea sp. LEGE XX443]|uniref:PEP-CTERM sorting domain-containing protein n=1 Tax=Fortiea sp. LEGE XX443 TaxID=1828611 RepID=UPI0018805806|nr:PEP-CTERM sorting domain-containing protein [Fortiea sp. LEGE XX443]MBE9008170.1 PEP-CTERM sorting domain-containing protein [Fortiea sp. LEGE XX443]
MKSLLVGLLTLSIFAPHAYAQNIIYNEELNGDLSNNSLNPTPLSLSLGSNQIIGSTTGNPNLDRDFFSFTILPGRELSQITLIEYIGLDNVVSNQGFFAVQAGSQIEAGTVSANTPPLLGAALIGANPGTQVGENILDNLGVATPIQGSTFVGFPSGKLSQGTYTFWVQETVVGIERYNLDFVVTTVPEPSTILGIGAAMSLSTFIKRKKRLRLASSKK